MTHTLRRWTGVLAALVLASLAGCSQPQPAGGRDHVRIALNWFPEPEHGGFYAALVHGYYQEAGLDVEILPGGPDVPLLQRVAAGQATFGVENADLILIGRAAGVAVQSVMAPIQVSPRCIMVHEESGITRLEDLREMTLAMSPQNPFYHYLLRHVPPTGVTVVPYPGSVARFLVDMDYGQQGYVLSEPLLARREGARPRSLLLSEIGFNPYTSTLFCTDELAPAARALVAELMAAPVGRFTLPEVLPEWREVAAAALAWRPAAAPERGVWIRDTLACLDGVSRHFFCRLPVGYDPQLPAPLLLDMHGGVSREKLPDLGDGDFPEGYLSQWATERGMILVVPTGQRGAAWWDETGARHVLHILRVLKSRLAVDHERVFVTGFSDGGSGSYFLAQFHPTDFAAFLPQCGHPGCDNWGEPKRQAYFVNLRNRPVYAINNEKDALYPAARIHGYLLPAWEAGADLRFHSYPDYGHRPDYWEAEQERMGAFLDRTSRDPLRSRLTLEGADPVRCDWLEILAVDSTGRFPGEWTDWNSRTVSDRVVLGFQPDESFQGKGYRVATVVADSTLPAARLGLRAGDVVTALGAHKVDSEQAFRAAVSQFKAGDPFTLELLREGRRLRLSDHFNPPQFGWLHDRTRPSLRVEASLADNRFDLRASGPGRVTLWLDPQVIDFSREVTVFLEGREILRHRLEPDARLLLEELDRQRDPTRLVAGRLEIDLEAARTW